MTKSIASKKLKLILEKEEDYKTEFKEKVDKNLVKEIVAFASYFTSNNAKRQYFNCRSKRK